MFVPRLPAQSPISVIFSIKLPSFPNTYGINFPRTMTADYILKSLVNTAIICCTVFLGVNRIHWEKRKLRIRRPNNLHDLKDEVMIMQNHLVCSKEIPPFRSKWFENTFPSLIVSENKMNFVLLLFGLP